MFQLCFLRRERYVSICFRAETVQLVAAIEKETALLEAQAQEILGKAEQSGIQMKEEAKSDRFRLAVDTFGTPLAYNQWIFATGLPTNIDLKLMYAGEGTFWTDLTHINALVKTPEKVKTSD